MTQCDAMMLRCHFSKYLSNQSNPKNIKQSANTSPVKCSETLAKAEFRVSTGTQELTENTTDAMGTCDDEPTWVTLSRLTNNTVDRFITPHSPFRVIVFFTPSWLDVLNLYGSCHRNAATSTLYYYLLIIIHKQSLFSLTIVYLCKCDSPIISIRRRYLRDHHPKPMMSCSHEPCWLHYKI